jgi:hypothetical protein
MWTKPWANVLLARPKAFLKPGPRKQFTFMRHWSVLQMSLFEMCLKVGVVGSYEMVRDRQESVNLRGRNKHPRS